jgi:hypothetical protein
VRSRLCYGQEAYFVAARSHLLRLESRECSFLRTVLGLARHTPRDGSTEKPGRSHLVERGNFGVRNTKSGRAVWITLRAMR